MPRRHPVLYQLNTRVLLGERGRALGRPATLDDLPDTLLDEAAARGFDWVWPLGVWTIGPAARAVSRSRQDWQEEFRRDLPDLRTEDVSGSPFAIQGYTVEPALGGEEALARLRGRLAARGLSLLLDFVPNHVSPDHPWVTAHPEWLVEGTEAQLREAPANWVRLGGRILAHGRDPYFPGWADTVQLDYRSPGLRAAMAAELAAVARRCDGVRCDMAMLVLPEVFERTWGARSAAGDAPAPFWPEALAAARAAHPGFRAMAEVYWDLEWELQRQGFDFTYDKRLYDRLREGEAGPVRDHLRAAPDFQDRSARFLENHDEPRASSTFAPDRLRAAAVVTFLAPGLRFLHEGQLEGRRHRVSMHLCRRAAEPPDLELRAWYERLLAALRRPEVHDGAWRLRECRPAWDGNPTSARFIVSSWEGPTGRLLACVNYGPTRGQCRVEARFAGLDRGSIELRDLLGPERYRRDAAELAAPGLYLDLPPWGVNLFSVAAP